jgi:membrane protein implicated in regulation of membrane protease activity
VTAVAVAWLVIGIGLLLFEMHHLAFYALFGAVGAFAAAIVALVSPDATAVQGGVAVAVAAVGVVTLRPYVSRALHHPRGGHVALGVHGGIVGAEAITTDEVGDAHRPGHVRLVGERWLAYSAGGGSIPPHTKVLVTAVEGTTLAVLPVDEVERTPELRPPSTGDTPTEA